MTERKFTPPTEFPAEYVTRGGRKAVIMARTPDVGYPLVGWIDDTDGSGCSAFWAGNGAFWADRQHERDLFDIVQEPQKQVHWANDYGDCRGEWHDSREDADGWSADQVLVVIRREWVKGEKLPKYFAEKP